MVIFYKKLLVFSMMMAFCLSVLAQEKVSKKIEKTYVLSDAGEVHLKNKYGNIKLFGWDKNEVSVSIAITVTHKKRENAEELMNRIKPIYRDSDDYVSVDYEISERSSSFFGQLFDKANPFDFDRSNVQIDYTVYMPSKAELEVTNEFGDVILEDWKGTLKASLAHGDLWINENLNKADIDMNYGKVKAQSIGYGNLDLKNGNLDMEGSKNLRLTSSGSEIDLNNVVSLEIYSNKDEVILEEIGSIYGMLKFTTMEVRHLTKDLDLTMKIADFRVSHKLEPEATINIAQESSEISLNITDFSHQFKAVLEEGLVRLPKSFENVDSKLLDQSKKLREIYATYGKDTLGSITITGTKGVVLLKEL